ncbi:uncharacterized protein LOC132275898 [Cornus florida]|uniref:uncharacterized protein LOC132275898 n=1 Tax=Cornus florida TaxID=4283 RepID=UPI0028A28919|nr:uncharacterized protein LOC132275898 [Cornus florida]
MFFLIPKLCNFLPPFLYAYIRRRRVLGKRVSTSKHINQSFHLLLLIDLNTSYRSLSLPIQSFNTQSDNNNNHQLGRLVCKSILYNQSRRFFLVEFEDTMLHKSFKPAKCKTSLKLATARIKLLKNKKEAQVNQLKRELAKLLESGQDQNARIRVEHVVREEKMMAAYDLIAIYCELIAARLSIIESQKSCPIDLKEAIASIIFGSPRCADIPELLDVRKHFTAKYGKEFTSAAVELRPDCGVSRMLVEKLSVMAPDGQTKIKILSAIAEEHNIKWDPTSFGEKDSKLPGDLLNGPNSFEKAGKMNAEFPNVRGPNVHAPPSHDQKHDSSVNSFDQISRSSPSSQNYSSTDIDGNKTMPTSHPEVRPSGTGPERMEVRQSFSRDGNAFPMGRQNWNMEFKDATSAAQAAAESAERASMAARAAAELSSHERITRQHSTESQKSNAHGIRDEGPRKYAASKLPGEYHAKDSVNNSFNDRNSKLQNERIYGNEYDDLVNVSERFHRDGHGSRKRSSQSASMRPSKASTDSDTLVNSFKRVDKYSQDCSSEDEAVKANESVSFSEMSIKKQSSNSDVEFVTGRQDALKSEENYFGEERFRKQPTSISYHSCSSTLGCDNTVLNSNCQNFRNDVDEASSVGVDQENIHRYSTQTSSYDNASVVFDDGGSDEDDYRLDIGPKYGRQESKLYFPSPDEKSPTHLSPNVDPWSPRRSVSGSLEKSTSWSHLFADPLKPYNSSPAIFDDSDGPNSECEDELDKGRHGGMLDSSMNPRKQNVYSRNSEPTQSVSHGLAGSSFADKGNSRSDRKPLLYPSSDYLDSVDVQAKNNPGTEINADIQKNLSVGQLSASQESPRQRKSRLDLNDVSSESNFRSPFDEGNRQQASQSSRLSSFHEVKDNVHTSQSHDTLKDYEFPNQSSSEGGKELSFGILTGGLRNKGYRHPPYNRSPSGGVSSSSKEVAEDNRSSTIEKSNTSLSVNSSIGSGVKPKVNNRSGSRASIKHYDSDSDSSEEEFQQRREPYNQKAEKEVKTKSSTIEQSNASFSVSSSFGSGVRPKVNNRAGSRASIKHYDSDSDSSEEEFQRRREPYNQKAEKEVKTKSSLRTQVTYFDSDNGDSEGDLPKQTSTSVSRSGSGLSRRTKALSSNSETSSYSKVKIGSEASINSDERNRRNTYGTEVPPKSRTQTVISGYSGRSEQSSSTKLAASELMTESKASSREDKASAIKQSSSHLQQTVTSGSTGSPKTSSSKETLPGDNSEKRASRVHSKLPSSAMKQSSSHLQQTVTSGSTGSQKTSTPGRETLPGDNSEKRASHVHPKLPDYDTIAAKLQAMRLNRQ